jgi:hypothetical protein
MSLINDIKNDVKALRRMQLPWWGTLGIFILALIGDELLGHAGRIDLAYPLGVTSAALGLAIAIKWELRRLAWFWITMSLLAALHVPLLLLVPWTSNWVPAPVLAVVGFVDCIVMLVVLNTIARSMKATSVTRDYRQHGGIQRPPTASGRH